MQFNSIAKYYTTLSSLVFRSTLEIAKTSLFAKIPEGSKILIIGGGTGISLRALVQLKPRAQIDFVETSEQMILRAKRKVNLKPSVTFVQSPIEGFEGGGYDVIITEFFFDLFKKEKIDQLIPTIALKLNPKGYWIDTDFRKTDKVFHKILLSTMYLFLKLQLK